MDQIKCEVMHKSKISPESAEGTNGIQHVASSNKGDCAVIRYRLLIATISVLLILVLLPVPGHAQSYVEAERAKETLLLKLYEDVTKLKEEQKKLEDDLKETETELKRFEQSPNDKSQDEMGLLLPEWVILA
jgi:uncharacterized protein YlxW (UPF0749 family)